MLAAHQNIRDHQQVLQYKQIQSACHGLPGTGGNPGSWLDLSEQLETRRWYAAARAQPGRDGSCNAGMPGTHSFWDLLLLRGWMFWDLVELHPPDA